MSVCFMCVFFKPENPDMEHPRMNKGDFYEEKFKGSLTRINKPTIFDQCMVTHKPINKGDFALFAPFDFHAKCTKMHPNAVKTDRRCVLWVCV